MNSKPVDCKRLLDYILTKMRGSGNILELGVEDVINDLNISRSELDQALLTLEKDGYIRIIKIPPSDFLVEAIKKELTKLDGLFLLGEISRDEYKKKYEEIVGILTKVPDELRSLSPMIPIEELIANVSNLINSLSRLKKEGSELKPEVLEDLRKKYDGMMKEQLVLISRMLKTLHLVVIDWENILKNEERELEVLKADEKIRNVDLSIEKRKKEEKINEAKNKLRRIYQLLTLGVKVEASIAPQRLQEIEKELRELKIKLEVIDTKILIEGEKPHLVNLRKNVENKIKTLMSEMEKIKCERSNTCTLTSLFKDLEKLKDCADLLSKDGIEMVFSILEDFERLRETLVKLVGSELNESESNEVRGS